MGGWGEKSPSFQPGWTVAFLEIESSRDRGNWGQGYSPSFNVLDEKLGPLTIALQG